MASTHFTTYRAKYRLLYTVERGDHGAVAGSYWLDLDTGEIKRDLVPLTGELATLEPAVIPAFGSTEPEEAEENLLMLLELQRRIQEERKAKEDGKETDYSVLMHEEIARRLSRLSGRFISTPGKGDA